MKKTFFLTWLLFLLVFVSSSAGKRIAIDNQGIQREREGKIEEAISEYILHIEKHPEDVSIAMRLMSLLFREKRYRDIILTYDVMSPYLKKRIESAGILGKAYWQLGRRNDCIDTFESIIRCENGSYNSYSSVGNLFLSLGLVAEAKKTFLEGKKLWGDYKFSRDLYYCYLREHDYAHALSEVLDHYRNKPESRNWARQQIQNLIKRDESILQNLEEYAEENEIFYDIAGEIIIATGDISRAKKFLLRTRDVSSLLKFAAICLQEACYREAEEALLQVLKQQINKREKERANYLLSSTYVHLSKYDEALEALESVLSTGSTLKDSALIEKAKILVYHKKEYTDGARTIEALLKRKGGVHRDVLLKITVDSYIKSGELEQAEALAGKSSTALSFYLRGEILFLKSRYTESNIAFMTAVARGLDKDFANNALERIMIMESLKGKPELLNIVKDVEILVWKEQYDSALVLVNNGFDVFKEKDERTMLLFIKGRVYVIMGEFINAISSFRGITEESEDSPLSPKALFTAALLYKEEMHNVTMAEDLLRKIIFDYPESVEAELSRGVLENM